MILVLTILNSIAIAYLYYKRGKFYINWRKDITLFNNTLVGYHLTLWKRTSDFSATGVYTLTFPIKNKKKIEKEEEINRIISYSKQNQLQTLSAMFSHLRTQKEVDQFKKDYTIVDKEIVENLVAKFIPKN